MARVAQEGELLSFGIGIVKDPVVERTCCFHGTRRVPRLELSDYEGVWQDLRLER